MVTPVARGFSLVLPEQCVEVPLGELTEQRLRGLAEEIAGVFGLPSLDLGAVASAITLASVGAGVAAGGMPTRVKCLHVLVGHALAAGRGVNQLGDEALDALGAFWNHPCLEDHA